MPTQITIRISLLLLLAFLVPATLGQRQSPNIDPQTKSRKVKPEPARAFKQWIDDVEPIITPGERDAWNKLKTDEEREHFIDEFWHLRDSDPDTEENEYRESYYERVEYVN